MSEKKLAIGVGIIANGDSTIAGALDVTDSLTVNSEAVATENYVNAAFSGSSGANTYVVEGSITGTTLTLTNNDATTVDINVATLLDDTNLSRITSATFNSTTGDLTLSRDDATTVTVSLDGRYLDSYTETDPVVGAISGIVKSDGAGNITAAVAGTDYSTFDGTYNSLTGTPDLSVYQLSTSAFSGDYNDLVNTPTIPTVPTTISSFTNDSGYITDYTVTEADVTQHQAALSITESQISDLQNYLTSETTTSLSINSNILSYTDETGSVTQIDLSLYLDDTNLAYINSGSIDPATGIATFTRDDATSFTVDMSAFLDDTNLARIDSAAFNTTDGVLTFTRGADGSSVTVDLDGRFALTSDIPIVPTTVSSFTNDSGYITDYTVTQADVTQHQAALSITESQISDLGAYLTSVAFSDLTTTPTTLAGYGITDAFDGAYSSLTDTPDLSVYQLSANAFSGSYTDLTDKPTLFDGQYSSLTGAPTTVSAFPNDSGYITDYTVTEADVTQHQTALSITESQISDLQSYLTSVSFADLTSKPTTLAGYGITDGATTSYVDSEISAVETSLQAYADNAAAGISFTETNTSLSLNANTLRYIDETGTINDIDLSLYLDDTNLARLVSGSVDGGTGIATFTRDDATTFTVDFSALFDDTNLTRITSGNVSGSTLTLTRSDATAIDVDVSSLVNNTDTNDFLTGLSFSDGTLTANISNQSDVTVNLDGRYLQSYTETDPVFAASEAANITTTDTSNWDTAYGWGDHASAGYLTSYTTALSEDTTPQLGGNLDLNSNNITGTGNISIGGTVTAGFIDGTGTPMETLRIRGTNAETAGYLVMSASNSYGGQISLGNGASNTGEVNVSANNIYLSAETNVGIGSAGSISIHNLTYPSTDGSNGQVLTTNGSGTLSFADASGGISNLVEDTTPQLGGHLDLNGNNLGTGDARLGFHDNGYGFVSGATIVTGSKLYLSRSSLVFTDSGDAPVTITAPYDLDSSYTLTLPTNAGSLSQVLTTDGTGALSWTSSFAASLFHTLDNPNAYDTASNDAFGLLVSISGNYAIVGVPNEDDAGGTTSGKAYIYDVTNGSILHTLDNPNAYNTGANDNFGCSVSISGNYAIVGAHLEDDAGGTNSGKAYIFDVSTGALLHTLDNPNAYDTSAADFFGWSVGISGNYAIVGAYFEDDAGGTSAGKAYIFNVTTGSLVYTLDDPTAYSTSAGDLFGYSVAISGNYAIVGAYYEAEASGLRSGKAYIFDVSTGALLHTLDNPNAYGTVSNDYFGESVAISGTYAIVGAHQEDEAGNIPNSGKAYIFDVKTGTLLHTFDNPNVYGTTEDDNFSRSSVSISGNYAIVGAQFEDAADGNNSGKAYIYDLINGALVYTLDNPNAYSIATDDRFGCSVAISGNYAIVGAYWEDDAGGLTSGKAYIYQLSAPGYTPTADEFASLVSANASGGISSIVEDTSPQLGGSLDLGYHLISSSQNYVNILGSTGVAGTVSLSGNQYATGNGAVYIQGGNGSNGSHNVYLSAGGNNGFSYGDVHIGSDGSIYTNNVYINELLYPSSDGTSGQVLTTDGSGNLSFADAGGGGATSLNELSDAYADTGGNIGIGSTSYSFTASSGYRNISIGSLAGDSITTGDDNILLGYSAGTAITTGSNNIAIGRSALDGSNGISDSVAIGYFASDYIPANGTVAVGFQANRFGYNDIDGVYLGTNAGYGSTSYSAHYFNVHIGTGSGRNIYGGDNNTLVGNSAGFNINSGSSNTLLGDGAGYGTSTNNNTFVGARAGYGADGVGNIGLGRDAGYALDGHYNVAIGFQALNNSSITGSYNIGIGYNVDTSSTSVSNELTFGANAGTTGEITRLRIPGMGLDTGTATSGQVLTADGSGGASFQDAAGGADFATSYMNATLFS
jgi:hypothetical protein